MVLDGCGVSSSLYPVDPGLGYTSLRLGGVTSWDLVGYAFGPGDVEAYPNVAQRLPWVEPVAPYPNRPPPI